MSELSSDDEEWLEALFDEACEMMDDFDDDVSRLEEPYRTVAIIFSAQGIIDNGGFCYFFENDWPHCPPYSLFADAYERIGRIKGASAIRSAVASFGFETPETNLEGRRKFMEQNYNEEEFEVSGWEDCLCGDQKVWSDLAAWVKSQAI